MVVQDIFLTATAELADVVLPGRRGVGRERGHGHELRAARPARPQGARAARRGARRPLDHRGARPADGRTTGAGRRPRTSGTSSGRCRRSTPGCPTRGSRSSAGSSGRATTRTTRASCSSTAGSGRTRCPGNRVPFVAGRPRPAGRQARRRLPDPPDDRPPPRLVQHRRPDRRLHVAAAPRRVARHLARRTPRDLRPRRRRARPGRVAARPGRGARSGSTSRSGPASRS